MSTRRNKQVAAVAAWLVSAEKAFVFYFQDCLGGIALHGYLDFPAARLTRSTVVRANTPEAQKTLRLCIQPQGP